MHLSGAFALLTTFCILFCSCLFDTRHIEDPHARSYLPLLQLAIITTCHYYKLFFFGLADAPQTNVAVSKCHVVASCAVTALLGYYSTRACLLLRAPRWPPSPSRSFHTSDISRSTVDHIYHIDHLDHLHHLDHLDHLDPVFVDMLCCAGSVQSIDHPT